MDVGELRTSGVTSHGEPGGELQTLRIERIDVRDVQLQTALGSMHAGGVELTGVDVRVSALPPAAPAMQRLEALRVGALRLADARLVPRGLLLGGTGSPAPAQRWRLEPLGGLEGSLRAEIVDAAWIFDADVTVPIVRGRIDFNRATVEHVGPDSSMGVSRMGVHVDAPNGRTYLFLFSATHVPGARFEEREAGLLPGWRGDRGSIELQPLLEGLLSGLPIGSAAAGTREMVARTRLSGEFQLGDGVIGNDGRRVVLEGRDRHRNRVALSSLPSGEGVVLRMPDLSARELHWEAEGRIVSTGALSGTLSVQVQQGPGAPQVVLNVAELEVQDIRVDASGARQE